MTNKKNSQKIQVSITLDEDIAEEIRKRSDNAFRSFSQYINIVLRQHIERAKRKAT